MDVVYNELCEHVQVGEIMAYGYRRRRRIYRRRSYRRRYY